MPKQTGPKTPEGKAKSSINALKHGLTSDRMFVLCNENEHKWAAILKAWTDKLQPRDEAEFMVVEDIAHAHWRLRRARTWEGSIIDVEMEEQADIMAATYDPVDEGTRQACAFKSLAEKSRCLDHLHRYEIRARRAFKNGIAALKELRAVTEPPVPATAAAPEPAPAPEPEPAPSNDREKFELIPEQTPLRNLRHRPAAAAQPAQPQALVPEIQNVQNETKLRCKPGDYRPPIAEFLAQAVRVLRRKRARRTL